MPHRVLLALIPAVVSPHPRLIGGDSGSTTFPFVVGVMECYDTVDDEVACVPECTGSLISPNVVLTAGHCVEKATRVSGFTRESVGIKYMRITVGSDDTSDRNKGRLIGVTGYVNRGFFKNVRFPFDNDIGLIFLDTCLDTETIKLSVRKADSACGRDLTTVGYGTHSNLDTALDNFLAEHPLKHSRQKAHSTYTCKDMFVVNQKAMSRSGKSEPDSALLREWRESILDDTFLCTTGNDSASCHGDSGGPLLATDPKSGNYIQVGVTSSGTVDIHTVFCGAGPNIYQRLFGHLEWIEEQLKQHSCRPVSESFVEYPLPPLVMSAEYYLTRCDANSWQCGSGACIPAANRCDGTSQCTDGSDERCLSSGRAMNESKPRQTKVEPIKCDEARRKLKAFMEQYAAGNLPLSGGDYDVCSVLEPCKLVPPCKLRDEFEFSLQRLPEMCKNIKAYHEFQTRISVFATQKYVLYADECPIVTEEPLPSTFDPMSRFLITVAILLGLMLTLMA